MSHADFYAVGCAYGTVLRAFRGPCQYAYGLSAFNSALYYFETILNVLFIDLRNDRNKEQWGLAIIPMIVF